MLLARVLSAEDSRLPTDVPPPALRTGALSLSLEPSVHKLLELHVVHLHEARSFPHRREDHSPVTRAGHAAGTCVWAKQKKVAGYRWRRAVRPTPLS